MQPLDFKAVVRHYRSERHADADGELRHFAAITDFRTAVGEAAMCRVDGHKLSHQWRIPIEVLEQARSSLLAGAEILHDAPSFASLHREVETHIGAIRGIGELTVYDIALRIGARRGLMPKRVYLHAGARDGARALRLKWRAQTIALTELPQDLRVLDAREAEDVLCIFKTYFRSGAPSDLERVCRRLAGRGRGIC